MILQADLVTVDEPPRVQPCPPHGPLRADHAPGVFCRGDERSGRFQPVRPALARPTQLSPGVWAGRCVDVPGNTAVRPTRTCLPGFGRPIFRRLSPVPGTASVYR